MCRKERRRGEGKGKKRNKSPRAKQFLGRSGRWLFLLLILMQNWFCVDAAAVRLKPKGEAEVPEIIIVSDALKGTFADLDGKSLREEQKKKHYREWKRSKGVDRTGMRKEEKRLRCALPGGSAWSTERNFMRRYKGAFDVFFGIEHRLRKEEMEEQFNGEAKEGWKFAASAARITEETAGYEDRKHTSGGIMMPIDSNLGAVLWAEEGAIVSIPGNEGRIAQTWVNVRGRLRIFLVYFWHSEGWTSRNEALLEAVLKRARTAEHPWLIACDADMSPEDFERSLRFRKDQMHEIAPERVSTCRSKHAKGEWMEKVYDYVVACSGLKGRISEMKVTEDFESRPHKVVTFIVKSCRRRYLDTAEEDYLEEARRRKEGMKEKKAKEAEKGK